MLTQDFEGLPAAAPWQLTLPDHIELVCGSLDALPARFSSLDIARREAQLTMSKGSPDISATQEIVSAALPLPDRRLVRKDSLRERIQAAAQERVSPPPQFHVASIHMLKERVAKSQPSSTKGRIEYSRLGYDGL